MIIKDMELSRLAYVSKKRGVSIKTIIPQTVIKEMQISVDDVLQWKVEEKKGEKIVCVKKVKD